MHLHRTFRQREVCGYAHHDHRAQTNLTTRPSKSRIARLENENHTLRASLERLKTTATPSFVSIHTQIGGNQPSQTASPPSPGPTPISTSTAGSRFHGPSSALYEIETPTAVGYAKPTSRNHADEKRMLFAETSRQRKPTAFYNLRLDG